MKILDITNHTGDITAQQIREATPLIDGTQVQRIAYRVWSLLNKGIECYKDGSSILYPDQTISFTGTISDGRVRLGWTDSPTADIGNTTWSTANRDLAVASGHIEFSGAAIESRKSGTGTTIDPYRWEFRTVANGDTITVKKVSELTYLYLSGAGINWTYSGALPVGLTVLFLNGAGINWTYSGALPVELTYLYLSGAGINWTYSGALPVGLATLYLDGAGINWTYSGALPVGLTYLYLAGAGINWTYSGALHVGLTVLFLNGANINWTPGRISGWRYTITTGVNSIIIQSSNNVNYDEYLDSARPKIQIYGNAGNQDFSISYNKPKISVYLAVSGGVITTTYAELLTALQAAIENGVLANMGWRADAASVTFTGAGKCVALAETTFAASATLTTNTLTNYSIATPSVANISELIQSLHYNADSKLPATSTIGECPSLVDTNVPGIWFSSAGVPTNLAIALKAIIKTAGKALTLTGAGITAPGGSGDGTGFPIGFGDWWRS